MAATGLEILASGWSRTMADFVFVISGSQTGGIPDLSEQHYAVVLDIYPEENRLVGEDPIKQSSAEADS